MISSAFAIPENSRYFEDYVPGLVLEFGSVPLSQSEIIQFAEQFDPQAIHTSPEAAARGPYGGLIASGWQTVNVMMRLCVKHFLSDASSMGSPGIDELRWMKPVRPGDTLGVRVSILEANRSRSKPDRGLVRAVFEVLNQHREVVLRMKTMSLIRCREAEPAKAERMHAEAGRN